MGKLQLINRRVFHEGMPIDNYFLERVITKRFPGVSINFVKEDDSMVYIGYNGDTVAVKHLIYLKEGDFDNIESWEKEVERTLLYIQMHLFPEKFPVIQEKTTDLV